MANPKKKHRVAFRKNRGKRTRVDAKIDAQTYDENNDNNKKTERVGGKGDLSRFRTVVGTEADPESGYKILRDIDEEACVSGRVLHAIGSNQSAVQLEDGKIIKCSVRRVLRTIAQDARSAVVTGDYVKILLNDDETGVIERVEPRRQSLVRTSQRKKHIIASNVDQVVIVASALDPSFKPALIDRFIVAAEKNLIVPIVAINKMDLTTDVAQIEHIMDELKSLGYHAIRTSVPMQLGIAELRKLMHGKITAFTGQSGVGKSSLLNAVHPDFALKTGKVSGDSKKGKHTTRSTELIPWDKQSWVIDTPGIRQLELWDLEPYEVEAYFVDFQPYIPYCKYPDCSHTHEDPCAVKKAVEDNFISERRYDSYLRIMNGQNETEMAAQRWKRNQFPLTSEEDDNDDKQLLDELQEDE